MSPDDIELVVDNGMSEDPYFTVDVITPDGSLQLMGEVAIGEGGLIVRGLHVGGDPAAVWGWPRLRTIGRLIAEKLDVAYIEVHGAVRTTGAKPGRRPGIVRLSRPAQPDFAAGGEYA